MYYHPLSSPIWGVFDAVSGVTDFWCLMAPLQDPSTAKQRHFYRGQNSTSPELLPTFNHRFLPQAEFYRRFSRAGAGSYGGADLNSTHFCHLILIDFDFQVSVCILPKSFLFISTATSYRAIPRSPRFIFDPVARNCQFLLVDPLPNSGIMAPARSVLCKILQGGTPKGYVGF